MFNLGGDDKEKLKENMEEIKDLVNSQESEKHSVADSQESDESQEMNESQVENQSKSGKIQNPLERPSENKNDSNNNNNADNPVNNTNFRPVSENQQQNQLNSGFGSNKSSSGDRRSNTAPTNSDDSIEERLSNFNNQEQSHNQNVKAQSKPDQDLNDKSSDTLFLEVDEFNRIEEMVNEMKYLSREMNDLMNNLEGGVDEDRRIESEAQDVIDEFSQRRSRIESSIN